jgi:hypothetical protein
VPVPLAPLVHLQIVLAPGDKMSVDANILEKELIKIIHKTKAANKPTTKYIIPFASFVLSGFVVYLEGLNTNTINLKQFVYIGCFLSFILLLFLSLANKASIAGGMFNVKIAIEMLLEDNWDCKFKNLRGIHPYIIVHPVFRAIIGLYAYKYGKEYDGIELIKNASLELPDINNAIQNGVIINKQHFEELYKKIEHDLFSTNVLKSYGFVVKVLGIISIILLLAYLVLRNH